MNRSIREVRGLWRGESVWIKIVNNTNRITKIGCIYRSPNADTATNDTLCQDVKNLADEANDTVLFGDFNFPEINWLEESCRKDETHIVSKFLEASRDGF